MDQIELPIELEKVLQLQQQQFKKTPYRSYDQRLGDLQRLKRLLLDNQVAFATSLNDDFGHRSVDDTQLGDILTTVSCINYSIKHLKYWMKPKHKHIGLLFQPASGKVLYQPLGVIGIVTPWNYPVFLSLGPLTTALAAGNSAMIKMSEYTPKTSQLLAKLLAKEFDKNRVAVVGGDVAMAAAFSALPFDHLFFTGSTAVGKLVMKAAAENLVPVTLELGGKSPAIIDDGIDLKTAVSRFILGKTLNSGQTCVAPDYIFCPQQKIPQLIEQLRQTYSAMYPKIKDNQDCTSVINQAQFSRINSLLDDAKDQGAEIHPLLSEPADVATRKMPLTVLTNVTDEMQVMQQEIFGPILPIIGYTDRQEVIDYITQRERPLALYIYSFDKEFQQDFLYNSHAGGVCINDAAFHVANDDLPFGGVGSSGMGNYHGEEGFKTFSHAKAVFSRGRISFAHWLFPPFGTKFHQLVYKLFIR
jgi:coniferyl-aldehyde dehydrogenase